MIKKHELVEGAYYIGTCRNTKIAQWFKNEFIFIGMEFNRPYIEKIQYFGDVQKTGFDGFIPIKLIEIVVPELLDAKLEQDYKNVARKLYLNTSTANLSGEIWKPVPKYEELYYVSNYGRVKNSNNLIRKQLLSGGYLLINLTKNKKPKMFRVHRLVAMAFNDDTHHNLEVNHINGVRTDNRETNLEWVTHSENAKHSYLSGNVKKKLNVDDVKSIKKMLINRERQEDIAEKFNISQTSVSEIKSGKRWGDVNI